MTDGLGVLDYLQTALAGVVLAAAFVAFGAGVLQLARGDVYARAHGLLLATGAGSLLTVIALAIEAGAGLVAAKTIIAGVLVVLCGLVGSYLSLRSAQEQGVEPESDPPTEEGA